MIADGAEELVGPERTEFRIRFPEERRQLWTEVVRSAADLYLIGRQDQLKVATEAAQDQLHAVGQLLAKEGASAPDVLEMTNQTIEALWFEDMPGTSSYLNGWIAEGIHKAGKSELAAEVVRGGVTHPGVLKEIEVPKEEVPA